jgi:hypothetical protein
MLPQQVQYQNCKRRSRASSFEHSFLDAARPYIEPIGLGRNGI